MKVNCQWCNKEISVGWGNRRRGVQFCDENCRYRYHNAQKKAERQFKAAIAAIAYLHALEGKGGELGESARACSDNIAGATVRRMVQS
jgi:hypothetical protein